MSVQVDLLIETTLTEEEKQALGWIEKVIQTAAEVEELPPVEVAITIVDNQRIQELNREYRGKDQPTDVLSFPLWEPDEEWVIEEGEEYVTLGDLIISIEKAKEQAQEYGHSLEREIGFLAVHGFLHLLGYDHETKEQEEEMFGRQEEILQKLGLTR
jgi:probable rRNA maturation factor